MGRVINNFGEWIIESIPWSDVWLFLFLGFFIIVGASIAVIIGTSDLPTWLKHMLIFGGMFLFFKCNGYGLRFLNFSL